MIIKLKCEKCGFLQVLKFEEIEKDMLYICKNCKNLMNMRDSSKLTNLLTLEDFKIIGMYDCDSTNGYENFEKCIELIKNKYNKSTLETQEIILSFIQNICFIIRENNSDYISLLNENIHKCYLEIIEKNQSEFMKFLEN